MKITLLKCLCWILLSFLPSHAKLFNPKIFQLDNGLTVVVIENHRVPLVKAMMWYKVGSADDQPGKTGLAHFLEHMMFKGTQKYPGNFYMEEISRRGGLTNAATSRDYTSYYAVVHKNDVPIVLDMEADRMQNLTLPESEVGPERKVVLEERRMRTDNQPSAILHEAFQRAIYQAHPYGRPVIGWAEDIKTLDRDDLKRFYTHYYKPNNAILVLVGDISATDIRPQIEKSFGSIPGGDPMVRHRTSEPEKRDVDVQLTLADPTIKRPYLYQAFSAPHFRKNPKDVTALNLLNLYLFNDGPNSTFYDEFVEKNTLATSLRAHFNDMTLDPAVFILTAQPSAGVSLRALERKLYKRLRQPIRIDKEKLERLKKRFQVQRKYLQDDSLIGGEILGETLTLGIPVSFIEEYADYIQTIQPEDLIRVHKKVFSSPLRGRAKLISPRKTTRKIKANTKDKDS